MSPPLTAPDLAAVRIVLCTTTHPGNIGAAARAMKTMGVRRLDLVTPRLFPDEEATKRAVGAADLLDTARVHATLDSALAGCHFAVGLTARRRDLSHDMVSMREACQRGAAELATPSAGNRTGTHPDATALGGHPARSEVAFVFGTEMSGLSNDELARCQLLANIPTDPEFGSLNLGSAVQLVCYELRQAVLGDHPLQAYPQPRARHEDVEALFAHLERTLHLTGFLHPRRPKRLMERLRRLLTRTRLEDDEVSLLRGLLRSVELALGAPAAPIDPLVAQAEAADNEDLEKRI